MVNPQFDVNFYLDYFYKENENFKRNIENLFVFMIFVLSREINKLREFLFLFRKEMFGLFQKDKHFNSTLFFKFLFVYRYMNPKKDFIILSHHFGKQITFEKFERLFFNFTSKDQSQPNFQSKSSQKNRKSNKNLSKTIIEKSEEKNCVVF